MAQATFQPAIEVALQRHRDGRLPEAEQLYRQILAQQPTHADALHYLGVIAHQVGRREMAAELIRQSLALQPGNAEACSNLGVILREMGQLDEAIAAFRRSIARQPKKPETHNNLANALRETGDLDGAIAAYRQAIALKPGYFEACNNLGNLLRGIGRLEEAIASSRQAIAANPNAPEPYNNLGIALRESGRLEEAIIAIRHAIVLNPKSPEAHNNLGNCLNDAWQLDEAISECRWAIRLKPDYAAAYGNLGNALRQRGQLDDAIVAFRRALNLNPNYAEAASNLGIALAEIEQWDDAIAAYRYALAHDPNFAAAHNNLGNALKDTGKLDEAVASYRQAIALKPDDCDAYNNLGNALKDMGQLDAAVAAYREAVALDPGNASIHSNLVYTLHFHPGYDAQAIYQEASAWSQQHAAPLRRSIRPHDNDRDPERPLRIGYVSADFRIHPVGFNFLPLALSHDQERYSIVCYSGARPPDAMTRRLRSLAREWRDTDQLSDAQLAELIRQDKIDILVDLGLHMGNSRLLVFARKPAPVQITALCSMGTTGLPMIDYRISDQYSDPPGFNDAYYAEETVRLPDCYFCHEVPPESPPVNAVPATESGHVTFGSLNNFCKVTPEVLDLWGQILAAVPDSRLLLRCPSGTAQASVRNILHRWEVAAGRIGFIDRRLARDEYLRLHHQMDIDLDPFPYSGHTTSLDALWMGVPLITLAGRTDVGRSGVFLLTNLNMQELIAQTRQEYVQKAVELAHDLPRLAAYRAVLRQRMLKSPLLDTPRFARNVEAACRQMWRKWCQLPPLATPSPAASIPSAVWLSSP
jgi:protein O-GlcNAc transferase